MLELKEQYRQEAFRRVQICESFITRFPGYRCNDAVKFIESMEFTAEEKLPSAVTLRRWVKTYIDSGRDPMSLAPKYKEGDGPGTRVLDEQTRDLLMLFYCDQRKWSMSHCVRKAEEVTEKAIDYTSARRFLQSLPKAFVIMRREGKDKYNNLVNPFTIRDPELLYPMQRAVSDHHMLDFMVRHEGRVFRPWLTAFTDFRSRIPLGWTIVEKPDKWSILLAFYRMTEQYGLADEISIDNGKDYKSHLLNGKSVKTRVDDKYNGFTDERIIEMEGIFSSLGIETIFATPYHGQSKPIERWFGTLAEDFSKEQSSYVGSNTASRPDEIKELLRNIRKMEKRQSLPTLYHVQAAFDIWVEKWANTWKHSGKGMNGKTPMQVFNENRKPARMLHENSKKLIFTEPIGTRLVSRTGITLNSINYYSNKYNHQYLGEKLLIRKPIWTDDFISCFTLDGSWLFDAGLYEYIDRGDVEHNISATKHQIKAIKQEFAPLSARIAAAAGSDEYLNYKLKKEQEISAREQKKKAVGESFWEEMDEPVNNKPAAKTGNLLSLLD